MTLRQAIAQRVRRVRLPEWHNEAHLEFDLLPDGTVGPWATIRDVTGEMKLLLVAIINDSESRYEVMPDPTGPALTVSDASA